MNVKPRPNPILLLPLLAVGCAAGVHLNQQLYDTQLTKQYAHSRDTCFSATLKALGDIHTPVERSSTESGMIWSGKGTIYQGADTNSVQSNAQVFTDEHRITVRIEGDDHECTVRTVRWEIWENNTQMTEVNAGALKSLSTDPFFSAIASNLARAKEFEQAERSAQSSAIGGPAGSP